MQFIMSKIELLRIRGLINSLKKKNIRKSRFYVAKYFVRDTSQTTVWYLSLKGDFSRRDGEIFLKSRSVLQALIMISNFSCRVGFWHFCQNIAKHFNVFLWSCYGILSKFIISRRRKGIERVYKYKQNIRMNE